MDSTEKEVQNLDRKSWIKLAVFAWFNVSVKPQRVERFLKPKEDEETIENLNFDDSISTQVIFNKNTSDYMNLNT